MVSFWLIVFSIWVTTIRLTNYLYMMKHKFGSWFTSFAPIEILGIRCNNSFGAVYKHTLFAWISLTITVELCKICKAYTRPVMYWAISTKLLFKETVLQLWKTAYTKNAANKHIKNVSTTHKCKHNIYRHYSVVKS